MKTYKVLVDMRGSYIVDVEAEDEWSARALALEEDIETDQLFNDATYSTEILDEYEEEA
jgi:hypothetical protein